MRKKTKIDNKWKEYADAENRKRQEYLDYIKTIKDFDTLPRAEAWLNFVAKNRDDFVEQEALVYFKSRGKSCEKQIEKIIEFWKEAQENATRHSITESIF